MAFNHAPGMAVLLACGLALAGCGPSYSPDSYDSGAVQKANPVDQGVIIGARPVGVTNDGATGAMTGAAAGGIAGSQLPLVVGMHVLVIAGAQARIVPDYTVPMPAKADKVAPVVAPAAVTVPSAPVPTTPAPITPVTPTPTTTPAPAAPAVSQDQT